jgi:cell division protein FtsA
VKNAVRLRASIDLGTTKVSAMIAEWQGVAQVHRRPSFWAHSRRDPDARALGAAELAPPAPLRIIGVGTTPAEGLKQGVIVDIDKVAAAVSAAAGEAEQMAGISVRTYNVGVAGEHIRSMNSRGVVAVPDLETEIGELDVCRALDAATKFSLPYDREIIHTLPQEYIVDDQKGIRHPIGMYGSRLEARVHVVTASRPALDNVAKAMRLASVGLGEMIVEPLASSWAAVTPEERRIGAMLMDIGGGTTDVMLFVDGGVVASGVIGLGGNNITNDIAYGLRTSQQDAEEIKIRHGSAVASAVVGEETIDVPTVGFGGTRRVAKHMLSGIIEPRVKELFSLINVQITENKLKKALGAGLILTGGSAMLKGVKELAEQVFELPVRIGYPHDVDGLTEVVGHPKFSTGVGLLYPSGEAQSKKLNSARSTRRLRQSFDQLRRTIASFI